MKFKIVYDKPCRIRFRCGNYAIPKEYEESIRFYISTNSFVKEVDVTSINGGILVMYKTGFRDKVVELVKNLNINALAPMTEKREYGIKEIDKEFKDSLLKIALKRVFFKAFVPNPIATALTIYNSVKYIKNGLKALSECKLNVDVLDSASIVACFARKNFKTASTVMFLLSISSLLEKYTRERTKAVLTDSLVIKTDKVWLVTSGEDVEIPITELQVGDKIRIHTGNVIPIDGIVTDGEATVNEASITGESLPVMKVADTSVYAGTVIEEGSVVVRVRELSSNTKISKIIELIDNSENLKASVQSNAENLADRIVPFSFLGFFLTLIFTRNVNKALSLLMVDYSCAIKLSTPIAVISAIREAAVHDITIKGCKYLEAFSNADTIVFDKTGTLTNAEPTLEKIVSFGKYSEEEILKIAACLEEHFPHSVANAVVNAANERGIAHLEEHTEVNYVVAHGISTTLHGKKAIIGSKHFVVEDEHITVTDEQDELINEKSGACSVLYLAIGDELVGVLCISDPPRDDAKDAITELKSLGIDNIVMLTGDSYKAAKMTAEQLGITEYKYQVLPEDKHKYIEDLKDKGHCVIMVGDGINDTPALAAANVSVAMNDASDIARETADITIKDSSLNQLARIRILSKELMERIHKNYRFILGFNSSLLLLGFMGVITPSLSALLHNASTMMICAKSMTPLSDKKKKDKEVKKIEETSSTEE
nr:heavy metal translocating P-type ATPase [uncultured Ruminococcus sp.]